MQSKIITTSQEFYNLKSAWERLEQNDDDSTYYSTFKYNWTWWDVYKEDKDKSLFIICVYKGNKVLGIAPFIIQRRSKKLFSYNILKFMAAGDYLNVLVDRNDKSEFTIIKHIFKVIEENAEKYERMEFTHISSRSILAGYLLKSCEYNEYFKYLCECPIIDFEKMNNFDEYKKCFISSTTMKYRNKLNKEVGYKFEVIKGDDKDVYDEISCIHKEEQKFLIDSKNRQERSSLFNDEKRYEVIKKLYKDNKDVITFVLKDKEGDLISYTSCYFYKGVLYSWNEAYNPKYRKYSPSQVRYYEVFKFIYENQFAHIFDFGAGGYPWKFRWTRDFVFDYKLDMWNEKTKKGRFLKKLYKVKAYIKG